MPPLLDVIESLGSIRKKHRLSKFPFLRSHFIWRPKWYKYFDSYVDDFDYPLIAPDVLLSTPTTNDSNDSINESTTQNDNNDFYDEFFN